MLVFQLLLLVGYAYAHLSIARLSPRGQAVLHAAVVLGALAFLPVIPAIYHHLPQIGFIRLSISSLL